MAQVAVVDLWKSYRVYEERASTLKETLLRRRTKYREFWALRDISLTVDPGQMLGVIGTNGSGKSTLLKAMAGIVAPNHGLVSISGKVSALLELGTGFHPELTGRENVFLAGAILGQTREQTASRFDEIVAFSGLEGFIDSPVKNYSSGMYARLAFSVAIHVDPEILLIDEVLAVGDHDFQVKCIDRLQDLRSSGIPIVFVSHNLDAVRNLCSHVAWLEKGRLVDYGETYVVVGSYLDRLRRDSTAEAKAELEAAVGSRYGSGEVRIDNVGFVDASGKGRFVFIPGELLSIVVEFAEPVSQPAHVELVVHRADGSIFSAVNTHAVGPVVGVRQVRYEIAGLPLWEGSFRVSARAISASGAEVFDARESEFGFTVRATDESSGEGPGFLPGRWAR